jgi:exonuclease SbcC
MIKSILLKNFRKHKDLRLEFNETFNLIHGRNNAGKSTIFYAIEYCFFGNVLGFKKISQLATFKSRALGVELIFISKEGDPYKLQRMHKLVGKKLSATGFFTLKKIHNNSESYIFSSDFGDHEEDLSLKINELTGISKRFFETGIHFHQGMISEILNGSKKLDIVFGISAATTLANVFRSRALNFEKESSNIDTLEVKLNQLKKDKTEQTKKIDDKAKKVKELQNNIQMKEKHLKNLQKMKNYVEKISTSIKTYENAKKELNESNLKLEIINKEFQEIKDKYGPKIKLKKKIKSLRNTMDKAKKNLIMAETKIDEIQKEIRDAEKNKIDIENRIKNKEEIAKELNIIIEKLGKKEDLTKKFNDNSSEIKKLSKKIIELEAESEDLQKYIRDSEREKGDLEGILKRRNNTKDKPKCEYCGAPIDPIKIEKEIKISQKQLRDLEKKITENENKAKNVKNELIELRMNEKQTNDEIHLLENSIQQIKNLEKKQNNASLEANLEKHLQSLNQLIKIKEKSLKDEKKQLSDLHSEENNMVKQLHTFKTQLEQLEELEKKVNETNNKYKVSKENVQDEKIKLIKILGNIRQKLEGEIKEQNISAFKELESQKDFMNVIFQTVQKLEINIENFSFKIIVNIRDELRDLILTKSSEIRGILKVIKNQLNELEGGIEYIKEQMIKLDKEIAFFEKDIYSLKEKKSIAENYRNFQNIFNEVQNIIRQNASTALEKRILTIHQILSSDDEFKRVHIDIDNYSLSVVPKGIDSEDYYPASVYQGGGHKLILGLSYKKALGDLIGSSPFILIDEPTEFMDSNNRLNLLSNIKSISKNSQILLITHQDVEKIQCNKKIEIAK